MRYDILGFTPATGQWRNSKEKADIAVANYQKYIEEFQSSMTLEEYASKTGITSFIRRIPNGVGKNGGVQHWVAPNDTMLRTSNWTDIEVSQIGKEIDLPFDNPKSKQLLIELVKLVPLQDDDIVLDFFSGSATTAHAVMQLNAEDGGHRKFIMVQLPEVCDEQSEAYKAGYKNICEIGKERIRRAGDKIKTASPLTTQDLDIGFRVFKLDETNMTEVYYSADEYSQNLLSMLESNVKADRTDLDLLFGCLLEWGLPLSLPYTSEQIEGYTVHTYNEGDLIACFDENIQDSVIKEIARRQPLRAVFRDSSFASSPSKINVGEIFKMLAPDTRVKVI
jgi:adenine-specific DNA-methyltransferase